MSPADITPSPPAAPPRPAGALGALLRPGRPPRVWVVCIVLLPALVLLASYVLIQRGHANHGRADAYFREGRTGTDLSALLLAASGVTAWTIARRVRTASLLSPSRHARFWIFFSVTLLLAAADDRLGLHELADKSFHALLARDEDDPITDHLDDALVALYGLAALAVAWRHRTHILSLPWFTLTMAAAGALFAAMVAIDVLAGDAWMATEETVKLLAGALILTATLTARAAAPPNPSQPQL